MKSRKPIITKDYFINSDEIAEITYMEIKQNQMNDVKQALSSLQSILDNANARPENQLCLDSVLDTIEYLKMTICHEYNKEYN